MLIKQSSLRAVSLVALIIALPSAAHATPPLPTGGVFAAGSGSIGFSGAAENVTINGQPGFPGLPAPPAVINWAGGFDVATGNTITYAPSTTSGGMMPSVVINQDTSGALSSIAGTISSPSFAQVVVNPNGISIAGSAVLPSAFSAVAGTWNSSNSSVTGTSAPITIANGVTYASGTPNPATEIAREITVVESPGNPLPLMHGMTAEINAPTNSSFKLYQNEEGNYVFNGPPRAPSGSWMNIPPVPAPQSAGKIGIDGTGVTVGSISVQAGSGGTFALSNINSSGDVGVNYSPGIVSPQAGTTTIRDIKANGRLGIQVGLTENVTVSGVLSAPNGTTNLNASAANGTFLNRGAYFAPDASLTSTLSISSGTKISAGNQIDIFADNVSLTGAIDLNAPYFQIESNHEINPPVSVGASISNDAAKAFDQTSLIAAPSLSNMSITSTGPVTLAANSISSMALDAPNILIGGAEYGGDKTATGGYAPLSISETTISGGGLGIESTYGVSMDRVIEAKPAGAQSYPGLSIIGMDGKHLADKVATENDISITDSALYGRARSLIMAGSNAGSGSPLPGVITIVNSKIETAGNETGSFPMPSLVLDAQDGGKITVDATSILSADGAGSCSAAGVACSTEINGAAINFSAGNHETASGSNSYAGTLSGTPNASPAETSGPTTGTLTLQTSTPTGAAGGSIDIAGYLDAGQPAAFITPPPVVPPPVVVVPPSVVPTPPIVVSTAPASTPKSSSAPTPVVSPPPTGNPSSSVSLPGLTIVASLSAPPPIGRPAFVSEASSSLSSSTSLATDVIARIPSAAALSTIQVRPDASIHQTEMQGNTLLVPETPDAAPNVTVSAESKPSSPSHRR